MTTNTTRPGLRAVDPIGHTTLGVPVYPARGGRGSGITFAVGDDSGPDPDFDDTDDEDEDDDDDDDDADGDEQPRGRQQRQAQGDDGYVPPSREAVERMEQALKRANGEAAKRRRIAKDMERLGITDLGSWLASRGLDPETGQPIGDDVVDPDTLDDEPDGQQQEPRTPARRDDRQVVKQLMAAEQRGRTAARDQFVPLLAQQAAENALLRAGFRGNLDVALRFIRPDLVDVEVDDESFEVVGIDEQIEELRESFPQMFQQAERERPEPRTGRPARRTGGARVVDGGDRGRQKAQPKTWAEQMAAQLDRGRR